MRKQVVLVGAGGHCKVIIDSIDLEKYKIMGILDNFIPVGTCIYNIPVIGTDDDAENLYNRGVAFSIITVVGNLKIRRKLLERYRNIGFKIPNIVHRSCCISPRAQIGEGVTLLANVCINAEAKLENYVTVNTGEIVEHEVHVSENSHIAPGAVLLGSSQIGRDTMIGAGAVILQQKCIGDYCQIGAGSVVLKNVETGKTVYGNPAREKN